MPGYTLLIYPMIHHSIFLLNLFLIDNTIAGFIPIAKNNWLKQLCASKIGSGVKPLKVPS